VYRGATIEVGRAGMRVGTRQSCLVPLVRHLDDGRALGSCMNWRAINRCCTKPLGMDRIRRPGPSAIDMTRNIAPLTKMIMIWIATAAKSCQSLINMKINTLRLTKQSNDNEVPVRGQPAENVLVACQAPAIYRVENLAEHERVEDHGR
jgi:hypothetical protein